MRRNSKPPVPKLGEIGSTVSLQPYRMSMATRLLYGSLRFFTAIIFVSPVYWLMHRHGFGSYFLAVLLVMFASLVVLLGGRQLRYVLVLAQVEGNDLRLRRWDKKEFLIPKRGRALRKDNFRTNQAMVYLRVGETAEQVTLLRQDKLAMAWLSDLERRGVIRGPASPKDRLVNPALIGHQ